MIEKQSTSTGIELPLPSVLSDFSIASRGTMRRVVLLASIAILVGWAHVDLLVYREISERLSTPDPLDHDFYDRTRALWETLREFGSVSGGLVAFAALLLVHSRGWRVAIPSIVAVILADTIGFLAQGLIGRLRPNHSVVNDAAGWFPHLQFLPPPHGLIGNTPTCFPSGEATAAFALATALSACCPRATHLWFALAALVAFARVAHGSHFLSDVVAGGLLGYVMTTLLLPVSATLLTRRLTPRRPVQ